MIKDIKNELLSNPDSIINILESYDFFHPVKRGNEIRFGYGEGHNPTAIRLKLSETLWVSDYVRSEFNGDMFEYIIKSRIGVCIWQSIQAIKVLKNLLMML